MFAKWLLLRHHSFMNARTFDAHKCGKCLGFERILMPNQDVTERLRHPGFVAAEPFERAGMVAPAAAGGFALASDWWLKADLNDG